MSARRLERELTRHLECVASDGVPYDEGKLLVPGDLELDVVIRCNAICKPPTARASLHRLLFLGHGFGILQLKIGHAKATTDLLTIWPVLG